jgi:DNA-directed RNA polymerase subunit RPC12/RpoP
MTGRASQPTAPEDEALGIHAGACPQCGAPVEPLDRFCPGCGIEQPAAARVVVEAEVVQRHFRCKNCGAEVGVDPDQRSYVCPFCDSTYVVEFDAKETDSQPPEFVIGFSVPKEQAHEKFLQWIGRNGWFRPSDLKSARIEDKLRGVYLPFWSFSMLAESEWSADIGEHWYRTETYTEMEDGKMVTKTRTVQETEWWGLGGKHHRYYSGYLVSGSRGLPQRDADRIKPFQLPAMKRYKPFFLAGWLSEEYSVGRDEALKICQDEFYRWEQGNVAAHLPGDTHRGLQVRTWFRDVNSDLVLLPVYLLSYRYRDKLYRFLINGQTGKCDGDKPVSAWKILAAVGVGVLAVLIALLLFAALGAL